ncbi:unnamed protein product [Jaminaea pallidilutea]
MSGKRGAPMPLDSSIGMINDMLHACADPSSPGFSRHAVNTTAKLVKAQRISTARSGDVEATKQEEEQKQFFGRATFRMQCQEGMANQLGNLHGGCAATMADLFTSLAIYLHVADSDPSTPWGMLGVTQSLSLVYLAAVPAEEWMEIECNVLSLGSRVAVMTGDIWLLESEDGPRVKKATYATHTKLDRPAPKM